jgi:hypothetical protein
LHVEFLTERYSASIFYQVPDKYPNPATVVTEIQRQNKCPNEILFWALIYTWRQNLYTGNILLVNSANNQASKLKNGVDFFNGVQVGVEILT